MFTSRLTLGLVALLLVHVSSGFQFYLHAEERRCFTETVARGTKVLGEYTVSTGKGKMEVDITVKIPEDQHMLYHQKNIGHGKFAFLVPFDDSGSHKRWRVIAAEFHRKHLREQAMKVFRDKLSKDKTDSEEANQRRKLLSSGYTDNIKNIHRGTGYERQFDEHGRAKPPADHEKQYEQGVHHHDHHDDHSGSHSHEGEKSYSHGHHHHHDSDDDFHDDYDDFDMDEYDGIHDEELDEELEHEKTVHMQKHGADDSDPTKKVGLYEDKKIEVCVSNHGSADADRRRVRLIIHKGETAHDYTRLAKREHMNQLEVSLRRVSEELRELMLELDRARQREDGLRIVNESTSRRVVLLAVVSLLSLAAVGSCQAMYTKRFLKRKKIL